MKQPIGFNEPLRPRFMCKLNKALYGLKQAPRVWFQRLISLLLANCFFTVGLMPLCLFAMVSIPPFLCLFMLTTSFFLVIWHLKFRYLLIFCDLYFIVAGWDTIVIFLACYPQNFHHYISPRHIMPLIWQTSLIWSLVSLVKR